MYVYCTSFNHRCHGEQQLCQSYNYIYDWVLARNYRIKYESREYDQWGIENISNNVKIKFYCLWLYGASSAYERRG